MKVKLLVSRGGPGIDQRAGDEIDVSDAEGKRMIEANQAVPVGRGPAAEKKETATKKAPAEKATK
jgi:hypothetical protein